MKKFIFSSLFLLVSLVACRENDVPMPEVPAAEDGFDIVIIDDFARVPVGPSDSVVDDSGLPLETDGGDGKLQGIITLKHLDTGSKFPNEVPFDSVVVDSAFPLETHDGELKGIITLKRSIKEWGSSVPILGDDSGFFMEDISGNRLPGTGTPGQVGDGGGVLVIEDKR